MKKAFAPIAALLIVCTGHLSAQYPTRAGARPEALAGSYAALSGASSVFGNQAGLAGVSRPEFMCTYTNRFLLDELSSRSGQFVLPILNSVFAVSMHQFGKGTYKNEQYGFAFARKLSSNFHFGLQYNYSRVFMPEDNRFAGTSGVEFGIQYLAGNALVIGMHAKNPYQSKIETLNSKFSYPFQLNFGVYYPLSELFAITSELEYRTDVPLIFRTGLEYQVLENFYIRSGVSAKPYLFSGGIGFNLKKLCIDLASSYHPFLGNSPSVSFQYQL